MNSTLIFILYLIPLVLTQRYIGDFCNLQDNSTQLGHCVLIDECNYAKNLLLKDKRPETCGFQKHTPIVCCPMPPAPRFSKQYNKTEKACEDYRRGPTYVALEEKALYAEFPHMASIGFGDENDIKWSCGGSLISELFVLTVAHCLYAPSLGNAKWARLGDPNINNITNKSNHKHFKIIQAIPYPNYSVPILYHDIALLKLNESVRFNMYMKPICLHTKYELPSKKLIVTGWGRTGRRVSSHLLKANLQLISLEECKIYYDGNVKILPKGIFEEAQVCAGDLSGRDSCDGDSGGPLQSPVGNFYVLIGITSFGEGCGIGAAPGVYTRVSYYIPWIEEIVWRNSYN